LSSLRCHWPATAVVATALAAPVPASPRPLRWLLGLRGYRSAAPPHAWV